VRPNGTHLGLIAWGLCAAAVAGVAVPRCFAHGAEADRAPCDASICAVADHCAEAVMERSGSTSLAAFDNHHDEARAFRALLHESIDSRARTRGGFRPHRDASGEHLLALLVTVELVQ
jgi:hypothetical protein